MLPYYLVIAISIQQAVTVSACNCSGPVFAAEKCYWVSDKIATHRNAYNECRSEGGRLATIDNSNQSDFIKDYIVRDIDSTRSTLWIGVKRNAEDIWVAYSRPVTWDNWAKGKQQQNCVMVVRPDVGWKDNYCGEELPILCESLCTDADNDTQDISMVGFTTSNLGDNSQTDSESPFFVPSTDQIQMTDLDLEGDPQTKHAGNIAETTSLYATTPDKTIITDLIQTHSVESLVNIQTLETLNSSYRAHPAISVVYSTNGKDTADPPTLASSQLPDTSFEQESTRNIDTTLPYDVVTSRPTETSVEVETELFMSDFTIPSSYFTGKTVHDSLYYGHNTDRHGTATTATKISSYDWESDTLSLNHMYEEYTWDAEQATSIILEPPASIGESNTPSLKHMDEGNTSEAEQVTFISLEPSSSIGESNTPSPNHLDENNTSEAEQATFLSLEPSSSIGESNTPSPNHIDENNTSGANQATFISLEPSPPTGEIQMTNTAATAQTTRLESKMNMTFDNSVTEMTNEKSDSFSYDTATDETTTAKNTKYHYITSSVSNVSQSMPGTLSTKKYGTTFIKETTDPYLDISGTTAIHSDSPTSNVENTSYIQPSVPINVTWSQKERTKESVMVILKPIVALSGDRFRAGDRESCKCNGCSKPNKLLKTYTNSTVSRMSKKDTSKYKRKVTSALNGRPSEHVVGGLFVIIVFTPVLLIIVLSPRPTQPQMHRKRATRKFRNTGKRHKRTGNIRMHKKRPVCFEMKSFKLTE